MRAAKADALRATEFLSKYPQPVVLHFQPSKFEIAESPEALREWEDNLIKLVGLEARGLAEQLQATGTCTTSCCPDCDDCDAD